MSKSRTYTTSAIVLAQSSDGQLPSRIELMPVGPIVLNDQRGAVATLSNAEAVIARSLAKATGNVLPIDFAHGMDGRSGADPRAAGWITGLSVEGDRIMADVEWTPAGEEAVRGKIFRFISPTFTADEGSKQVDRILRAGLTNNPALPELAKVASQQETDDMPKWLETLAAKLGMPEETDETKIMAAAEAAVEQAGRAAGIVTAAGLDGELTETAATAITARLTVGSEGSDPDPAKFVTMAAFQDVSAQLAALQKTVSGDRASAVVAAAMSDGKVSPALEPWAKSYAEKDLEGFRTWLASAPVIVDGQAQVAAGDPPEDTGKLTKEEKAVCAASGISEEAFLATKQGKALPGQKKAEG